ncbi:MAG: DegT/DnrJ/EryC1/StrS family aminotransferase [Thermoleophilaceae bacterium]
MARPELGDDEIAEVVDTLRSGWLVGGPKVAAFEAVLEQRLAPARVRCLSSASAGLLLGLRLAGVGPGDEVVMPTLTFAACPNAVELLGATPVFVDSEPLTGLVDLDAAERRLRPRTKAILPVHLGGRPVDVDRLNQLRDASGVAVVEDAAHAIGAEWRGGPIGTHGNATSFSFHASKNMTTIEGGALALPKAESAERVERLRLQGLSRSAWSRHGSAAPADYELDEPGFKLTMSDVSAAIGIHQLARLDGFIERREELAQRYDELLADLPLELEPAPPAEARHARHLYAVRIAAEAGADRDQVVAALRDQQIGTSVHFKPLHRFRYYRERYRLEDVEFPVASDFAERTLSLPLHPAMGEEDLRDVVAALHAVLVR